MTLSETAEPIARQLTSTHLRLLGVCLECPKCDDGTFAGEWVRNECERQGVPFHQARLTKLANVGLVEKADSSRGGNRRYYRLRHSELAREILGFAGRAEHTGSL